MLSVTNNYKNTWSNFYSNAPRQRHADLQFLTLLHRYTNLEELSLALVLGAGDGVEAFELARFCEHVYATDYSEEAIQRINGFNDIDNIKNITTSCISQLELNDLEVANFDLVVSWSVISYINRRQAIDVIKQIANKLKNGGFLIILFEGDKSSIMSMDGTINIGDGTYKLSPLARGNMPNIEMTFYNKKSIYKILEPEFEVIAYAARDLYLPPEGDYRVNQHYIVAKKYGNS